MRAGVLAFALALAFVTAGCSTPDGVSRLRGVADGAPEPYYKTYSGVVDPQLDKTFDLAVQSRATLVNVTLALATRSGGVAGTAPSPAQLTADLVAPDGKIAKSATVTAQQPAAIVLLDAPAPGAYHVHLSGSGLSGALQGADYGASYVLVLQVEYAGAATGCWKQRQQSEQSRLCFLCSLCFWHGPGVALLGRCCPTGQCSSTCAASRASWIPRTRSRA